MIKLRNFTAGRAPHLDVPEKRLMAFLAQETITPYRLAEARWFTEEYLGKLTAQPDLLMADAFSTGAWQTLLRLEDEPDFPRYPLKCVGGPQHENIYQPPEYRQEWSVFGTEDNGRLLSLAEAYAAPMKAGRDLTLRTGTYRTTLMYNSGDVLWVHLWQGWKDGL
jgi:hypothetical protein